MAMKKFCTTKRDTTTINQGHYGHQGIIYALKNQILTWKLMASERFPLLPPDYGTSSPLKFELVLMLIFLNLSWKRLFLKRYMTFSFVIFVFVFVFFSFLFKMCTVGLYVSLCLMIFLCPFLHCKALRTAMYKRYINYTIIIITKLSIITWAIVGLHVIFFSFQEGMYV